jgi:hypothetical protein
MTMTNDLIFDTFAREFDLFLDMNPDLDETDGDAFEMLMFHPDLTPRHRLWLEDFCARFDAAMDQSKEDRETAGVMEHARWYDLSAELE